jgi:hypothetical protein
LDWGLIDRHGFSIPFFLKDEASSAFVFLFGQNISNNIKLFLKLDNANVQFFTLAAHFVQPLFRRFDGAGKLRDLRVSGIIEIEQFANLRETKAEALTPKDQRKARTVTIAKATARILTAGMEQTLGFIETKGARGYIKLAAKLSYCEDGVTVIAGQFCIHHGSLLPNPYVNVNMLLADEIAPSKARTRSILDQS